jgi:hypothetical protein
VIDPGFEYHRDQHFLADGPEADELARLGRDQTCANMLAFIGTMGMLPIPPVGAVDEDGVPMDDGAHPVARSWAQLDAVGVLLDLGLVEVSHVTHPGDPGPTVCVRLTEAGRVHVAGRWSSSGGAA